MLGCRWLGLVLLVVGCAPHDAGQQVGQSLHKASVNTGDALADVGDRAGQALQNAGSRLRSNANKPPAFEQQSYPLTE